LPRRKGLFFIGAAPLVRPLVQKPWGKARTSGEAAALGVVLTARHSLAAHRGGEAATVPARTFCAKPVGVALFLIHYFPAPGELAHLSTRGLLAAWILTLPWSLMLVPLFWALFHDAQHIFFSMFFVTAAAINSFLIMRSVNALCRPASNSGSASRANEL